MDILSNIIMPEMANETSYEAQYMKIAENIMTNGYRQKNERTGVETKRIPHAVITVDLAKEFPILKSKFVTWKSAIQEILWIMQKQSNNIKDLGNHIWDAWADKEGSIGKAYGYQVAKPVNTGGVRYASQVAYVLNSLTNDPSYRRAVIDLWNVDDLDEMNLTPCCYSSVWSVIDGKLNCMLVQRSADFLVGVPFNTTQYAVLTHLFARHLGLEVGILTHVMADAHIYMYDSHAIGYEIMKSNFKKMNIAMVGNREFLWDYIGPKQDDRDRLTHLLSVVDSNPKLVINTTETNFFSISVDDIRVEDYRFMEKIKFDVAT